MIDIYYQAVRAKIISVNLYDVGTLLKKYHSNWYYIYALKLQNIVIQKIKIDAPISKFQFWKNDLRNPDSLEKITLYIYTINNLVMVHWFKKFKKALYFPLLIRSWYISTYYDIACIEIMHRLGFKNW